ncbi:MAG TPA: D-alanyl-D-alanine carboxypeptidase/D-alanyl-D-alanine-endopeptidase [Candidatus Dormibacteraeota bacterium]|nr:D-alanyl-D-alanine carboxypeptidase/D-alanyl-D-alanine-endopeptidase [Candidatus Dormibacteraeota bacterium]
MALMRMQQRRNGVLLGSLLAAAGAFCGACPVSAHDAPAARRSVAGPPTVAQKQRPCGGNQPCEASTQRHLRNTTPKLAKKRKDVERFAKRVDEILAAQDARKAEWGILIVDQKTGETLYGSNAENYFVPASNMKLFTTALAMTKLGPAYRFTTTVSTMGTISADGRLTGDLILLGRGDPNLSNRKFPFGKEVEREGPPESVLAELASALAARGIAQIDGNVIADDSYFSAERYPGGWEIDDMVWSYGAPVSALAVNDNIVTIELHAGEKVGDASTYTMEPWTEDLTLKNDVVTGLAGTKPELALSREPGARLVILTGAVPLGSTPHRLVLAIAEPAEHAARLLKRMLETRGITVGGDPQARHYLQPAQGAVAEPANEAAPALVLASHTSVPLADAIRLVNKISQNLHAEMLLRTSARETSGAITLDDALKCAREFYTSIGIPSDDLAINDGSGLSRRDLVTPAAVVTLLRYTAAQPWASVYEASLPISGEDGTLAERMKRTAAAGRIHAKTGTVEHVSALSGFAETLGGERLVFSIFGNNFAGKGHDEVMVIDAICAAMVEELGASKKTKRKEKGH